MILLPSMASKPSRKSLELERAQARARRPRPEVKPVVNKATTRQGPGLKAQ